ncbi:hypothetical protein M885DRAFT_34077 [Pelagophyceae sp. CCMP2097]|nr:hypothetical protein M885DRAFT_34077 [Pelagophyceae sp. CCMP2097]
MEVLTCLDEDVGAHLDQVADFSYSFEHLVKILVARLDGVNERVDALEARHSTETSELHLKIETLTHNIQGFTSNAERQDAEMEEMATYRAKLVAQEEERQKQAVAQRVAAELAEAEGLAAPVEEVAVDQSSRVLRHDGTPRNADAMRRWRWAVAQLRFRSMMRHMDLKGAKVKAANSMGHRLEALETGLDDVLYKMTLTPPRTTTRSSTTRWTMTLP